MGRLETMRLFTGKKKKHAEKFGSEDALLLLPRRLHTWSLSPMHAQLDAARAAMLARHDLSRGAFDGGNGAALLRLDWDAARLKIARVFSSLRQKITSESSDWSGVIKAHGGDPRRVQL